MYVGGPGDFNKKPKNFKSHFRKFQILFYQIGISTTVHT